MMMALFRGIILSVMVLTGPVWTQPLTLNDLAEYLEDAGLGLDAPQKIVEAVRRNGVDFVLEDSSLARIIEAARKGSRTDHFTASLVLQILRTCRGCAEKYFGPLDMGDVLLALDKKIPPDILTQEIRIRGTKGIPKTDESVQRLRSRGARPELVDLILPGDEVFVETPPGFTRLTASRSTDYNRRGNLGRLDLQLDVAGRVELIFVSNAVFARPLDAGPKKLAPSSVSARSVTFSAPAPSSTAKPELVFMSRIAEKRKLAILVDSTKSIVGGKGAKLAEHSYAEDLPSGLKGFRIIIDEPDRKQPHGYEIRLQWNNAGLN